MTVLNYAGGSDNNLGTSTSNPAIFSDSAENCSYTMTPPATDQMYLGYEEFFCHMFGSLQPDALWNLTIYDRRSPDTGVLVQWDLIIYSQGFCNTSYYQKVDEYCECGNVCSSTPEDASLNCPATFHCTKTCTANCWNAGWNIY